MEYTRKELKHLALCLGHCHTCSEAVKCTLKAKLAQDEEAEGTVHDALANHYHELYGLA